MITLTKLITLTKWQHWQTDNVYKKITLTVMALSGPPICIPIIQKAISIISQYFHKQNFKLNKTWLEKKYK
jgi:hypothetical protein